MHCLILNTIRDNACTIRDNAYLKKHKPVSNAGWLLQTFLVSNCIIIHEPMKLQWLMNNLIISK